MQKSIKNSKTPKITAKFCVGLIFIVLINSKLIFREPQYGAPLQKNKSALTLNVIWVLQRSQFLFPILLFLLHFQSLQSQKIVIDDQTFGSRLKVFSKNQEHILISMDSLNCCKIDTCNLMVWKKKLNLPHVNGLEDLIALKNGRYAYLSRLEVQNQQPMFVCLLDENFNIIWTKYIQVFDTDHFPYSILEDLTGNLILYGNLNSNTLQSKTQLVKISQAGILLWSKIYDLGVIWGSAISTSDDGILFRTADRLIKTDSSGLVQWSNIYTLNTYYYYAPVELNDSYIFSFCIQSSNLLGFVKIDKSGEILKSTVTNIKGPVQYLRTDNQKIYFTTVQNGNLGLYSIDSDLNFVQSQALINGFSPFISKVSNGFLVSATEQTKPSIYFLNSNFENNCSVTSILYASFDTNFVKNPIQFSVFDATFLLKDTLFLVENQAINNIEKFCFENKTLDLGLDSISICDGEIIELKNQTNSIFSTYFWSTGETSPSIFVSEPGEYILSVFEFCGILANQDTIFVQKNPTFQWNLGSNVDLCKDSVYLLQGPICENCNYLWNNGLQTKDLLVFESGNYHLTLIDSNQCLTKDSIQINYYPCDCQIFIPNAFSPNADHINDEFMPSFACKFISFEMKIYDSWGKLVFETNDQNKFWDGKKNGKFCPESVYVYDIQAQIHIFKSDTQDIKKTGTFHLIY